MRQSTQTVLVAVLAILNVSLLAYILTRPSPSGGAAPTHAATLPPAQPVAAEAPPQEPETPAEVAAVEALAKAPVVPRGPLSPDEDAVVSLFERASPSVVFITTLQNYRSRWGRDVQQVPRGSGSGFVWDKRGHIVTNVHVIAGANSALVQLADGSEYEATLVGVEPDHDLAVLRIDAPADKLTPIPVGTSDDLRVGQFTMAIGNPFGLDQTLTTGVVSALDREIDAMNGRRIFGVVQTDAAINPGNSGGPLLDSSGRLIGVNTAIQSPSGASAGIGFAVPVDTVNRIVPQLILHGKASRPVLGVSLARPDVARRFGVDGGVVVQGVRPGGPAEQAGITGLRYDRRGRVRLGDVLIGIDDVDVGELDDIYKALDRRSVGDEVVIKLERDGALREVKVTLAGL